MFSSEPLHPPPRPLRVNINDLLNPIRPSGTDAAKPGDELGTPSRASATSASTHTRILPETNRLRQLPHEHRIDSQFDTRGRPVAALTSSTSSARAENPDTWHPNEPEDASGRISRDGHDMSTDHQASFSLRSAQWKHAQASTNTSRPTLPPLRHVRELKSESRQLAPLSVSSRESGYVGGVGIDSINMGLKDRPMHPPSMMPSHPSPTSSYAGTHMTSPSAGSGFVASHHNAAPTLMAIPRSPYGYHHQEQHQGNYPLPPATLGPSMYAHHPHLAERQHTFPLVKPAQSPTMPSPLSPSGNDHDGSPTIGALTESTSNMQMAERASVRLAARGSKTPTPLSTHDESTLVLHLHPGEHAKRTKRTHSSVDLSNERASSAPRSSSLSSLSSLDSLASSNGVHGVDNAPRTKKARGKPETVSSSDPDDAPKNGRKTSRRSTGSEENANEGATGPAKSSKKRKEKEKAGSSPSHGSASGQLQPLDPQVTMHLGYGVAVVPVREGVPVYSLGYSPYPVSMHIQPLGVPMAIAAPQSHPLSGKWFPELQYARCMSARYKADPFPRCVSCTRRWAGDTCRFQNIRILLRDSNKVLWAVGFQDLNSKNQGPQMVYPDQWNVRLEQRHVARTMETVAKSLLPHLRKEKAHQHSGSVVKRQRETDVRATCDTCMTSLFSSTWMCRQCGREACEQCYETIRRLTAEPTPTMTSLPNEKGKGGTDQRTMKERHAQANPFFLSCNRKAEHGVYTFVPVTRFVKSELDAAVADMEALVEKDGNARRIIRDQSSREAPEGDPVGGPDQTAMDVDSPQASGYRSSGEASSKGSDGESIKSMNDTSRAPKSLIPEHYNDGVCTLIENPIPPPRSDSSSSAHLPASSASPSDLPSWPVPYYTANSLTESVFAAQWARGTPLVVTGLLDRFDLRWGPEYFISKYGAQPCIIVECQTDANRKVTVGEFFRDFGRYEGREECWKLKDWPPSTDFKTAFPELYGDFNRAVPVPSYTRRDGAYNIASHFPTNTIAPDLGPKMYNAFASSDSPGSKGSTRLHMDMADAVNIMVHAEATRDGAPGCAAWDIFRAEDSGYLRAFFKKNFKGQYHNDPIHAQQFYLDPALRAQLFAEFGVRSFRIYQRPGEAVFIPAGCAHQVCNLADSIKVACDFVSPENVERCEALTREFRAQNQSLVWKEDVLQLRSMMWFAWLSCRAQQEKWKAEEHGGAQPMASGSNARREKVETGV